MKRIELFLHLSSFFWLAGMVVAILLFVACSDEQVMGNHPRGNSLRFGVAQMQSRSDVSDSVFVSKAGPTSETKVFVLQGENPIDKLYLHAMPMVDIESGCMECQESKTRAMPVDGSTFYNSFGVLAYSYGGDWNESLSPNFMYNVEVTKGSDWTTTYSWPGSPFLSLRFFAYAPYNSTGVSLSSQTATGTPTITYTVPAAVADQKDLLVSDPVERPGNTTTEVPLAFRHALTAIRFVIGKDMQAGSISRITLKNIYGQAVYKMDGTTGWSGHNTPTDFSQTLSVSLNGSAGQVITPDKVIFMMLPQTLPEDASVEVVYTDGLTSTERIMTASIGGDDWPIGTMGTYRISLEY